MAICHRGSFEGRESSDFSCSDEDIDVISAFISIDGFHIIEVLDDQVLEKNAIATHDFACELDSFSADARAPCFAHGSMSDRHLSFFK